MPSVRTIRLTPPQMAQFDLIRRRHFAEGLWLYRSPWFDESGAVEWTMSHTPAGRDVVLSTRTAEALWRRGLLVRDGSRSTPKYWVFRPCEGLPMPAEPTMHVPVRR